MKRLFYSVTVLSVMILMGSCTPSIEPDKLPVIENEGTEEQPGVLPDDEDSKPTPDSEQEPTPKPEPIPEPAPDPEPVPDPNPEPEPTPPLWVVPQPPLPPSPGEPVVLLNYEIEVCYNGGHAFTAVKSSGDFSVEIPYGCDWIELYDNPDRLGKKEIWLTISPLPETTEQCEYLIYDWCCSHEDRSCKLRVWNQSRTEFVYLTVKQRCYGCSGGFKTGEPWFIEF